MPFSFWSLSLSSLFDKKIGTVFTLLLYPFEIFFYNYFNIITNFFKKKDRIFILPFKFLLLYHILKLFCYCWEKILDTVSIATTGHSHIWFTTTTTWYDWCKNLDKITCVNVFRLTCYKDINFFSDVRRKVKNIWVVCLFPLVSKSTKGTSSRNFYLASNVTYTVSFFNILEDVTSGSGSCFFFKKGISNDRKKRK